MNRVRVKEHWRKMKESLTVSISCRVDRTRLEQIEHYRVLEHRSRAQFLQLAVEEYLDRRIEEERKEHQK